MFNSKSQSTTEIRSRTGATSRREIEYGSSYERKFNPYQEQYSSYLTPNNNMGFTTLSNGAFKKSLDKGTQYESEIYREKPSFVEFDELGFNNPSFQAKQAVDEYKYKVETMKKRNQPQQSYDNRASKHFGSYSYEDIWQTSIDRTNYRHREMEASGGNYFSSSIPNIKTKNSIGSKNQIGEISPYMYGLDKQRNSSGEIRSHAIHSHKKTQDYLEQYRSFVKSKTPNNNSFTNQPAKNNIGIYQPQKVYQPIQPQNFKNSPMHPRQAYNVIANKAQRY